MYQQFIWVLLGVFCRTKISRKSHENDLKVESTHLEAFLSGLANDLLESARNFDELVGSCG